MTRDEREKYKIVMDCLIDHYSLSKTEVLSSTRKPRFVRARMIAFRILRDETDMTLKEIAHEFNRDHSTIIHGLREVDNALESEYYHAALYYDYKEIKQRFDLRTAELQAEWWMEHVGQI